MTTPCRCEHVAHVERKSVTPNGNPGHSYAKAFFPHFLVDGGNRQVCKDCANDCLVGTTPNEG